MVIVPSDAKKGSESLGVPTWHARFPHEYLVGMIMDDNWVIFHIDDYLMITILLIQNMIVYDYLMITILLLFYDYYSMITILLLFYDYYSMITILLLILFYFILLLDDNNQYPELCHPTWLDTSP